MEILFATSVLTPYDGPGAAERLAAGLPKALRALDHHVTVVSPLYAHIDPGAQQLARRLTRLEVEVGGTTHACDLYDGRTPGGVDLLYLGHDELFGSVDALDEGDEAEVARRVGLFARAVEGLVETRDPRPEMLHAQGWIGALAVARAKGNVPTLLTVHDAREQGVFDAKHATALGLPEDLQRSGNTEQQGKLVALRAGLASADRVTVGSYTYSQQLLQGKEAPELAPVLAELGDRFVGIPHGVDGAVWNPATDTHLPARFDPHDMSGKRRTKAALQQALGLRVRPDVCLLGYVHEGAPEGALPQLAAAMGDVLRNDVQIAVRAPEDAPGAEDLARLADKYPERLVLRPTEDETQVHRTVAGCDLLAIPAEHAPSGHLEMCAQRYGTLPVVPRLGAFADSVVDADAQLLTGSGFVYEQPAELASALGRALSAFETGAAFEALQSRAMTIDHSWDRSARLFDRQYRRAIGGDED